MEPSVKSALPSQGLLIARIRRIPSSKTRQRFSVSSLSRGIIADAFFTNCAKASSSYLTAAHPRASSELLRPLGVQNSAAIMLSSISR